MKKLAMLIVFCIVLISVSGCTAGPNELATSPDQQGRVAGVWHGLWHGLISPFTFVISLFSDTVRVYEVHNSGRWYDLGFVIGAAIIFGGSGGGAASKHRG